MATADDAKRAVRGLVRDMQREAYHAGATHRPNSELATPLFPARAALLRAADAMIDDLAYYGTEANHVGGWMIPDDVASPVHRDWGQRARDALARVAGMGDGRDA